MQKRAVPELHRQLDGLDSGEYKVNEIFYSIQGEGALAGTPMMFVRFSHCNLKCTVRNSGFDCDTEYDTGDVLSTDRLIERIIDVAPEEAPEWVLLTGGEPGLQATENLCNRLHRMRYRIAIETNGTCELPSNIDWVCVCPKSAPGTIVVREANEYKLVCSEKTAMLPTIEDVPVVASHYWCSVAWQDEDLGPQFFAIEHCVDLVKRARGWKLMIQQQKVWGIR